MPRCMRAGAHAASAIRYYEAEGLVSATRTSGGRRQFERNVLRRLAFIRAASNIGLTLDEIRTKRRAHQRVPEATAAAYLGLPGVLVWEAERC